jgi:HSP20 family molecular chaperone IbpA
MNEGFINGSITSFPVDADMIKRYFSVNVVAWQEEDDKFVGTVAVPGAKKKDIKVFVKGDTINIEFAGNEHSYKVQDSRTLPDGVTAGDVSVKYEYGVLKVSVAKPKGYYKEIKVE